MIFNCRKSKSAKLMIDITIMEKVNRYTYPCIIIDKNFKMKKYCLSIINNMRKNIRRIKSLYNKAYTLSIRLNLKNAYNLDLY